MHRAVRMAFLLAVVAVIVPSSVLGKCPFGDLDGDCRVDLRDVAVLAQQWLMPPEQPSDLNLDDAVNQFDLALLAVCWQQEGIPLAINEWMASNGGTKADPQGQFDDWIEIHNYGNKIINVGGMHLTDDLETPGGGWQIPTDRPDLTTIDSGGYLLIWADNDTGDSGLHAPFQLDADRDEIGLYAADGVTLIDSVEFRKQTSDISSGRYPDGSDEIVEMIVPTPGYSNVCVYYGIVEDTQFSRQRGFYNAPFDLTIATDTEGATIRYTTDCSTPGETYGSIYTGPIRISGTTILRAQAFKPNWQPSSIKAQTYVFVSDVAKQSPFGQAPGPGWPTGSVNGQVLDYGMDPDVVNDPRYSSLIDDALLAIPSISIATDPANLFNPSSGIYVNAQMDGRAWERPVSVELLNPDGGEGFHINAGLRIRGGYSRQGSNPKHAFRLFFRQDYGEPKLKYPLFGDEGVEEFDKIDLRCSQNYSWSFGGDSRNTDIREVWSRDLHDEMGHPYTRSRYYHLYINGHYWGLYQTQERSEARFAASYMGGDSSDYDVVKVDTDSGRTIMATDGNLNAYRRLYEAAIAGLEDEAYNQLQGLSLDGRRNPAQERLLDVDNLIDFMIIEYYTGDRDGPGSRYGNIPNNMFGAYNRNSPDGWKWFQHDSEHSLGTGENNLVTPLTSAGAQWNYFNPHWLHEKLTALADYRQHFGDHVQRHLFNAGLLTPEVAVSRVDKRAAQMDMAIIAESARWGDAKRPSPYTRETWLSAVEGIRQWIRSRNPTLLSQLKGQNWFPSIDAPLFNRQGGYVSPGFSLSMGASKGSIYYTLDGSDPRPSSSTYLSMVTLAPETAPKRVLMPTIAVDEAWRSAAAFDDSAWRFWAGSPAGVGYDKKPTDPTNYTSLIGLDMVSQMYADRSNPNANTTCFVRVPFTWSGNAADLNFMNLYVRFDDAFIAYLNGVEIARSNFLAAPNWRSKADSERPDTSAIRLQKFDVSAHLGSLRPGVNLLAIHAMNFTTLDSRFLISAELAAGKRQASSGGASATAVKYTKPINLNISTHVKARVLDGTTWSALNEAVFAVGPVKENLRITEIMYHPCDANNPTDPNDPNEEFIELKNIGPQTINLNLVKFTNGIDFVFGDVNLAPGAFTVIVENKSAFQSRYGTTIPIAGQYVGKLDNAGERIQLVDAVGTTILDFKYADGWRDVTDGQGYSLTIINPANPDVNSWDIKDSWRASVYAGGSPGSDDSGLMPNPGDVVINEVLAHAHAEASDWIELHNTTGSQIDIGGWFLSDANDDLFKYEIAAGTKIPAYGYKVFYEGVNFGNSSFDPGKHVGFALSENGEKLYLTGALDGFVTGYRDTEEFGASLRDISFGRYFKKSTGTSNFVALSYNTPWLGNSYPKVGPIVISEIMYNPDWPAVGAYTNDSYEYVELRNITDGPVTLYQYDRQEGWRFTEGIEYQFAGVPNEVTIPVGGYIVVVRNVGAFSWRYPEVAADKIYGPYTGALDNAGEKLELSMPGDVDRFGVRQWIRIDRVVYSDGSHADGESAVDLWPKGADGLGSSLQRINMSAYGNDPNNWTASTPTPAR